MENEAAWIIAAAIGLAVRLAGIVLMLGRQPSSALAPVIKPRRGLYRDSL
jgi:hypothetical protein